MSGPKFGSVKVILEDGSVEDFAGHSLSTGWLVGYDEFNEWSKKIPRDRIKEVKPRRHEWE